MNSININLLKLLRTLMLNSILLYSPAIFSQTIGINTENPQGIFHVDGKGDNDKKSIPTIAQQANDFIITKDGNVGIGTTTPTKNLHVKASTDPIKIEGLKEASIHVNNALLIDKNNIIKKGTPLEKSPLPKSAFFRLEKTLDNFLNNVPSGQSQVVPMVLVHNNIYGLSYNSKKSEITFPEGTYVITFNYGATHSGCTISSYRFRFPTLYNNDGERISLHSTAYHREDQSEHGGTFTFTSVLSKKTTWQINFDRGFSGNCSGPKMSLINKTTQLAIFKLGIEPK